MESVLVRRVSLGDFQQAFSDYGRNSNFSPAGLEALYEYLQDLAFELHKPIMLDVIALCCEYAEYDNLADFNWDHGAEYPSWDAIGRLAIYVGQEGAIVSLA